jgi:hypothetical protein
MADYTFNHFVEPLRNNNTIQTVVDIDALATPAKNAVASYVASLELPAAQTQYLTWENIGVAILLESLNLTYYLPSLGSQTPAPALRRSSTMKDKVREMQNLESKFPKCQLLIWGKNAGDPNWIWLNSETIQNSGNRVNTLKLVPYISQNESFVPGRRTQIGIQFVADPAFNVTLPQAGDRLTLASSIHLDVNPIDAGSKKNDEVERLRTQVAALELALEGRLINLPASTLLGRMSGTGTVERIPISTFATPAQVEAAVSALLGGAIQTTLDTLSELGTAIGNDPNFAATVGNALSAKVDKFSNEQIGGDKVFTKPIRIPYLEKDIYLRITTGINWAANTWYAIPGLFIPFAFGEMRLYDLVVNYQYNDGTSTFNHWQMGGNCSLPGGIGWKASASTAEALMILQQHNGGDIYSLSFRSAVGGQSRGLEVRPNFGITINGLGFIEFSLKRRM